jgi:hypothetical protein
MAHPRALTRLLVCPWVMQLPGLTKSELVRVDCAAALRAALVHQRFDAAFYIATPSLALDVAEACVREHAPKLALTIVDRIDQIAGELAKLRS